MRKSAKLPDDANVDLHMAEDGSLWYAAGQGPNVWDLGLFDFMESSNVSKARSIRLLGHASNAPLICYLWEQVCTHPTRNVEIATPAVCPFKEAKARPKSAFVQMRKLRGLAPSCGGWRPLTVADAISYRFRANEPSIRTSDEELPSPSLEEWEAHPAYPAMSFVHSGNKACQAWVLGRILDPRWYLDPTSPEKTSTVQSYMRLHPNVFKSIFKNLETSSDQGPRHSPARRMLSAWAGDCWKTGISSLPSSATFLLGNPRGLSEVEIWLRATQRFLQMVCAVWLDQLYPPRIYGITPDARAGQPRKIIVGGRQLFVPEHFFRKPSEVLRWSEHLEMIDEARNA